MDLEQTLSAVQDASRHLLAVDGGKINEILCAVADEAVAKSSYILEENRKDLERMDAANPKYDRLKLTEARLHEIADGLRQVAALPSPL